MTVAQIVSQCQSYPARHVVVTGGEPMIAPGVRDLTGELREAGLHVTIETAGTIATPVSCDLMSISPKLANSIPVARDGGRWAAQHDRLRYQPAVLKNLISTYEYQLKFVVSAESDLEEIDRICREISADRQKVVLMPEGTSRSVVAERSLWLVDLCKAEGFRFSPRLHIDLWGDKRGV